MQYGFIGGSELGCVGASYRPNKPLPPFSLKVTVADPRTVAPQTGSFLCKSVIPTGAQRSGGTCSCFSFRGRKSLNVRVADQPPTTGFLSAIRRSMNQTRFATILPCHLVPFQTPNPHRGQPFSLRQPILRSAVKEEAALTHRNRLLRTQRRSRSRDAQVLRSRRPPTYEILESCYECVSIANRRSRGERQA
jgi:hypothetical protein